MTTQLRKNRAFAVKTETTDAGNLPTARINEAHIRKAVSGLTVKPFKTYGKWAIVAQLPDVQSSTILTPKTTDPGNVGIIVGCADGSKFVLGEKVFFLNRGKIAEFPHNDPVYANVELIPMDESNIVCTLPMGDFKVIIDVPTGAIAK